MQKASITHVSFDEWTILKKGLWSGGHLVCWYYVLLSLRDPRVQAPFTKWNNKMSFVFIGTMLLRNVVLHSHLHRLPWRRMPINIKTHFYFTRAHSDSPGYPLDEKYIYDSFLCPPTIKLFSKLYRHSGDASFCIYENQNILAKWRAYRGQGARMSGNTCCEW